MLCGQEGLVLGPGKTEVAYLGGTVVAHQDIPRLEISMDNVQVVKVHLDAGEEGKRDAWQKSSAGMNTWLQ